MSDRRGRVRGRMVTPPLGAARAWVGADGSISLPSGNTYRIGFAPAGARRRITPGGEPPIVCWRESRGRIALTSSVFASAKGVFVKLEAENPFGEARPLSLAITLRGRGPFGGLRATESRLVSSAGETLLDIRGAKVPPAVSRRGGDEAVLDLQLVLPPRGRRWVDLVLEPVGRTRARSLGRTYAETLAAWEVPRGWLAVCRLPDGELAAAFDRAWYALAGSISPRAGGPDSPPWPRPGLEPRAGPATLDALALVALDEWGAGRIVEDCLRLVIESQGSAAPPGDSFSSARGFLSLPPEETACERWGSDCGALLWAMCSRRDIGARGTWFRSIRRGVEDACAWIAGELGADGLLAASRGPRILGRAARAWNDAWTWRGLDAAARMLEGRGAVVPVKRATRLRALAGSYRDAIARAYSASPGGRECLERLGVTAGRPEHERLNVNRLRALSDWADDLASASLTAEDELRTAVFLLRTLRRLLIFEERAEEGEGKAGALHIFPGVPPSWLDGNARLEIERMPTSAGPLTARVMAAPGGGRLIVEAELPKGAPETALHLGGRRLGAVRVNGRRWKRAGPRSGLVWLPKGGGHFDISAEIPGERPPRSSDRARRRKTRPK